MPNSHSNFFLVSKMRSFPHISKILALAPGYKNFEREAAQSERIFCWLSLSWDLRIFFLFVLQLAWHENTPKIEKSRQKHPPKTRFPLPPPIFCRQLPVPGLEVGCRFTPLPAFWNFVARCVVFFFEVGNERSGNTTNILLLENSATGGWWGRCKTQDEPAVAIWVRRQVVHDRPMFKALSPAQW